MSQRQTENVTQVAGKQLVAVSVAQLPEKGASELSLGPNPVALESLWRGECLCLEVGNRDAASLLFRSVCSCAEPLHLPCGLRSLQKLLDFQRLTGNFQLSDGRDAIYVLLKPHFLFCILTISRLKIYSKILLP